MIDRTNKVCEPTCIERWSFYRLLQPEDYRGAHPDKAHNAAMFLIPKIFGALDNPLILTRSPFEGILSDLISNSRDSCIISKVEVEKIEIAARLHPLDARNWIQLLIRDNGMGFDEQSLNHDYSSIYPSQKLIQYKRRFPAITGRAGIGLNTLHIYMEQVGGNWYMGNRMDEKGAYVGMNIPLERT